MRWKSQSMSFPYVETFSGSHQLSMLVRASWPLLLHLEGDLDRLAGLPLDLFGLLAERLVPHLDRVLPGRHVLDLHGAAGVGHARRPRHDRDPADPPAVDGA